MPALAVERQTVLGAVRRAVALVGRRYWTSLGVVTVGGLIAMALLVAVAFPFAFLFSVKGPGPGIWPVQSLGGMVASLIAIPYFVTLATVGYFDLRAPGEGLGPAAATDDLRRLA